MRCIVFILFLIASFHLHSQQYLIDNVNGQWIVRSKSESVQLPLSYHYVSNYDSKGFAYFGEKGRYGIVDHKGGVRVEPRYTSMKQLGGGFYTCLTESGIELIDVSSKETLIINPKSVVQESGPWYRVLFVDSTFLLNSNSSMLMLLDSTQNIGDSKFGFVEVFRQQVKEVFGPGGNQLDLSKGTFSIYRNYVRHLIEGDKRLIYSDREYELPNDLSFLNVTDEEVTYSAGGITTIMNPENGEIVLRMACEQLNRISTSVYVYKEGWKSGLVHFDGTVISPPEYLSISKSGKNYLVSKASGTGLLSPSGKLIIPCKYRSIFVRGQFAEVYSDLNYQGLYSLKTGKKILDANYSRLAISKNKIRAWLNDVLVLIEFDENHAILNRLTLKNTVSKYKLYRPKKVKPIDPRLYSIGWFEETTPKFDKDGFNVGDIVKWGIRNSEDSVICPPKYQQPTFIPQAGFSTLYRGKQVVSMYGEEPWEVVISTVINVDKGRIMMPEGLISVDTSDLLMRSFSRFSSPRGIGYITTDNKVNYVMHIDREDSKMVRYCTSKSNERVGAEEKDDNSVPLYSISMNESKPKKVSYFASNEKFNFVAYPEAEWNFLDTNGKKAFSQPFEFVHPYDRGTAIFKRGGKWGVVNYDSVIISNKYSSIQRWSELSDTVFKVKRVPTGVRYLDTLSHEIQPKLQRFLKSREHYMVVQTGFRSVVMDNNYNILSEGGRSYKITNNGSYFTKSKKEYVLYSKEGVELGTSIVKPVDILNDMYVVGKQGSKYGLVDLYGDTVLSFQYKSITCFGSFIFAKDKVNNLVYNKQLELIKDCKSSNVLFDEVNSQFVVMKGDKVTVYDGSGQKVSKVSKIYPDYFFNGVLIELGSSGKMKAVKGEHQDLPIKVVDVQQMEGYGYLVWPHADTCLYYTSDWVRQEDFLSTKKVRYVGEGIVYTRVKNGTLFYSPERSRVLKTYRVNGNFEKEGFVLIQSGRKFYYLNSNLENPFDRKFSAASTFVNGYATVKEGKGWTIIDHKGRIKSIDNFDEIKPCGNNVFSTSPKSVYGLMDSHGNEILPSIYEQINLLYGSIIQAVKGTSIFYFDTKGNPIQLDR
jgi:hypothetical protein